MTDALNNAKMRLVRKASMIFLFLSSSLVSIIDMIKCHFIFQVREVKGVIEQQNAEFPAAQLKLIHSGQILKDDSTLEEYKIKEDEFLVCMVTKVRRSSNQECQT